MSSLSSCHCAHDVATAVSGSAPPRTAAVELITSDRLHLVAGATPLAFVTSRSSFHRSSARCAASSAPSLSSRISLAARSTSAARLVSPRSPVGS
eukprot:scaffold22482_cov69-Phaeocystis_antarctica.AAC.3